MEIRAEAFMSLDVDDPLPIDLERAVSFSCAITRIDKNEELEPVGSMLAHRIFLLPAEPQLSIAESFYEVSAGVAEAATLLARLVDYEPKGDAIIVDDISLRAAHRGRGLEVLAVQSLLARFGHACTYIMVNPSVFGLTGNDDGRDADFQTRRFELIKPWLDLKFEPIAGTDWVWRVREA